jgi:hypothetical protein
MEKFISLRTPRTNKCRFKQHRFQDTGYQFMPRDERGRPSRVKNLFLVQSCADVKCAAVRLAR